MSDRRFDAFAHKCSECGRGGPLEYGMCAACARGETPEIQTFMRMDLDPLPSAPAKPAWSLKECRERDREAQKDNTDEPQAEGCPLHDGPHTRRDCQYGQDSEDRAQLLALVGKLTADRDRLMKSLMRNIDYCDCKAAIALIREIREQK